MPSLSSHDIDSMDAPSLRAALKENGIGRPSSRAGIIETLFKRHYIKRERKNLIATPTGIELIDLIHEELLKSCELTGIWEKKLRDIEHQQGSPTEFIDGLKQQVLDIVKDVICDGSNRRVTILSDADLKKKMAPKSAQAPRTVQVPKQKPLQAKAANNSPVKAGDPCPLCGKGTIIMGRAAYGCSRWKEGCTFRLPFQQTEQ